MSPGTVHTMLLTQDGGVWSTGVSSDLRKPGFLQVMPSGAATVAAGPGYSVVVKQDGSVWTTSANSNGKLVFFDGSTTSRRTFSVVKTIRDARTVAVGRYHSMVLTRQGRVWATGWNKYGQLGDGSTKDRTFFIRLDPNEKKDVIVAIAAGDIHSIVLKQDGSVWAAGRNSNGQLGDGSNSDRKSFVEVMSSGAADVFAGGSHSMVLKQDSSVWATGYNACGQLGDGTTTDRVKYAQVVSSGAKAIAAGRLHTMMLKQNGSVWTTGCNENGQLGAGWTNNSSTFVQVIHDGARVIAAGDFHSMVLKEDGSIWATGSNEEGQFGDGTTVSKKTFVMLAPFSHGEKNMCM